MVKITLVDAESYSLSEFAFLGLWGRRYVVFDVESTGAEFSTDSITQIGAVAVYEEGPRDSESFVRLVRPWKPIPEKIERLTGVTNEQVSVASNFASIWTEFVAFCGDAVLVTQCGYEFDFPIIDAECDRLGLARLSGVRLDTKAVFALMHSDRSEIFSTNFLSDYYGVDRSLFKRHDALGDAMLISRIFHAQLQEARIRGLDGFIARSPITIRRFVLPPI